jgi:hypothetical protein
METILFKAKNCEIGKNYLLIISPKSVYKVKIIANFEGSVTIKDERYSKNVIISGETVLSEYDEEFYLDSKVIEVNNKEKNIKIKKIRIKEDGKN